MKKKKYSVVTAYLVISPFPSIYDNYHEARRVAGDPITPNQYSNRPAYHITSFKVVLPPYWTIKTLIKTYRKNPVQEALKRIHPLGFAKLLDDVADQPILLDMLTQTLNEPNPNLGRI
jgi:hypothetical protein